MSQIEGLQQEVNSAEKSIRENAVKVSNIQTLLFTVTFFCITT